MSDNQNFNYSVNSVTPAQKSLMMLLAAVVLVGVTLFFTVRVERVSGTEIGVKVNNISGDFTIISESGTYIYNGLIDSFHLLDTTVQRLEMAEELSRGDRRTQYDLRIKTVDGSDVFLDLTINYMLKRENVEAVVMTSGLGDAYKVKWVRDYSRSVCRAVFGEMTTEEFYDASLRNNKSLQAEEELNRLLDEFGLQVTSVIAENFRFHTEYEAKIKSKKLADQVVEEQMSKANAADQNQIFKIVEATKKKDVFVASFAGKMEQLIVQAGAEAEKEVKGSESYSIKTKLGADAEYYGKEKNAQAITMKTEAIAEATKAMAKALTGLGGENIVRLAYANKMNELRVSGQPFVISGETERFSHVEEGSASSKRSSSKNLKTK